MISLTRRLTRALLGWSFDRLYDELAWAYDPVSWLVSGGRWRAWQRSIYPYLVPGRLLEIGPGPGHLLAELLARGHDAFGLERSPAMLRLARRLLTGRGHSGRLVGGDARSLPFANGSFSSVVLTFPSGYVFDVRFLAGVARVLRPGGRLVVVLAAATGAWPWPGLLEWVLGWTISAPCQGEGRTTGDSAAVEPGRPPWRLAPGLVGEQFDLQEPAGTVRLLVATRV